MKHQRPRYVVQTTPRKYQKVSCRVRRRSRLCNSHVNDHRKSRQITRHSPARTHPLVHSNSKDKACDTTSTARGSPVRLGRPQTLSVTAHTPKSLPTRRLKSSRYGRSPRWANYTIGSNSVPSRLLTSQRLDSVPQRAHIITQVAGVGRSSALDTPNPLGITARY